MRARGLSPFVAGVIALVVVAVAVYAGFTKRNPFADRFELRLAFDKAFTLRPGSPVRMAGVEIGKVRALEPAPGSATATIVKVEIRDEGLPLHEDATFKVRPRMFLEGNDFVDVKAGSPSAPPLEDGDTVPVQQTANAVGIPEVLTLFDRNGRQSFRTVLDEFGDALDGGGAEGYNRSIPYWEPAYRDTAVVADASIGERPGDLRRYLKASAKVAAALDRDPAALKAFVRDFATTAAAIGVEQRALVEALDELPPVLEVGYRALGTLNDAFPSLREFVADLRPAVRSSGPALDAQLPLFRELRGAVRKAELRGLASDLSRVVPELVHLTEGGVELQKQSRLFGSCQVEVIGPWQRDKVPGPFPSSGRVFEEGTRYLAGLAGESRNFDANNQYVRSQPNGGNFAYDVGDGQLLLSGQPLRGVQPPKAPQPTFHPDVPCETQQRPDLRSIPGEPPEPRRLDRNSPAAIERRRRLTKQVLPVLRAALKEARR